MKRLSINDPIHGLMQFRGDEAECITKIIDTPQFQRLRNIKQMGAAFWVYPGACHNRLSHSLGAAYIAKRVMEKLANEYKNENGNELFSDADINPKLLCILYALLHDIGHGPYSHAFEHANFGGANKKIYYCHEEAGANIVDVISENFKDDDIHEYLKLIKGMMNGDISCLENDSCQIVKALTSSQLDVDRMDYLLRDSYFCGVTYGEYDKKWLIHSLNYCKINEEPIIGINRKGLGAVEHYLIGRKLLYQRICHHDKIIAIEFILGCFIEKVYNNIDVLFKKFDVIREFKILQLLKNISDEVTQDKDNISNSFKVTKTMSETSDIDLELLINWFCQVKEDKLPVESRECKEIASRLMYKRAKGMPKTFEILYSKLENAKSICEDFKKVHSDCLREWEIHIDENMIKTYKKNSEKPIYIIEGHNSSQRGAACQCGITRLDEVSSSINHFSGREEYRPILIIDRLLWIDNKCGVQKLVSELKNKCCLVYCGCHDINE